MRRAAACVLIAVAGGAACGGPPTLSEREYHRRAASICNGARGQPSTVARRRWREFAKLRPPARLQRDHVAAVHLQQQQLAVFRRYSVELAHEFVAARRSAHHVPSARYERVRRESVAVDRRQAAAIRRLGLPRSCAALAGNAVFLTFRGSGS